MTPFNLGAIIWAVALPLLAEERVIDFNRFPVNAPPPGFTSTVTGQGQPGDWRIILEAVPPTIPALTPNAPAVTRQPVLAQLAQTNLDEHFPLLIFDEETFGDFTVTTRFKTVAGVAEQMAGLAFRIQDPTNYYVVRASSLGGNFRFYKFVNGQRSPPIGPDFAVPKGVWHELTVECKGNRIRCLLNGQEAIPALTDYTFSSGKIGFWTKSDSVSYFGETRMVYTPREGLATLLVRDALQRYPRLLGLMVFAGGTPAPGLRVVASKNPQDLGTPGSKVERDVIARDVMYTGKSPTALTVTLPLHDRNGEVAAAVRVVLSTFPGQTEQTAIARAMPIVRKMEERLRSAKDLLPPQ